MVLSPLSYVLRVRDGNLWGAIRLQIKGAVWASGEARLVFPAEVI